MKITEATRLAWESTMDRSKPVGHINSMPGAFRIQHTAHSNTVPWDNGMNENVSTTASMMARAVKARMTTFQFSVFIIATWSGKQLPGAFCCRCGFIFRLYSRPPGLSSPVLGKPVAQPHRAGPITPMHPAIKATASSQRELRQRNGQHQRRLAATC